MAGCKVTCGTTGSTELFGFQATGRKLARGARIYEFARSNLQEPLDIFKVILALSTLLPDDRHFPGDAQPTKWNLLHRFLLEHEKVGAFLQDLVNGRWPSMGRMPTASCVKLTRSIGRSKMKPPKLWRLPMLKQTSEPGIRLFLDSGAYTAWTKGQTIDVHEYIKFVHEVEPCIATYANVDVIPGGSDRVRTTADAEASARRSYRNLQIMKDAGLKPLPVFHQGEHFRWLETMLVDGEDYIGVSTAKDYRMPCSADGWMISSRR